jgi:hypothetical protein
MAVAQDCRLKSDMVKDQVITLNDTEFSLGGVAVKLSLRQSEYLQLKIHR